MKHVASWRIRGCKFYLPKPIEVIIELNKMKVSNVRMFDSSKTGISSTEKFYEQAK